MLNIFMDSTLAANRYAKLFIEFPNQRFNRVKEASWFEDDFVKEIISSIDNADVVVDEAIKSRKTGTGYSVDKLSGGAKALILMYELEDKIVLATMGDNCIEFVERIAAKYEKEGKELTIVSNYLHKFKFKYIKEIRYLNWDIICKSTDDIESLVEDKWYEHWKYSNNEGDM